MERISRLVTHSGFVSLQERLQQLEEDRIYCCHGMDHCMDVARIMYIHILEESLPYDKAVVYATALLHDLGRVAQYEDGVPHHEASVMLVHELLPECGFTEDEVQMIAAAVAEHREDTKSDDFTKLLYMADKKSRACFACKAADTCNWSSDKRNTMEDYAKC